MKKQKIYEKGITLIALVITIIVLLILAGVTLRIVMNGGIIEKSQNAVDRYSQAQQNETEKLEYINKQFEQITGIIDNTNGTENVKVGSGDFSYNNPVIPVGFKISNEGASWSLSEDGTYVTGWNEGLVIQDGSGNQFVWVPVDGTNVTYDYHYNVGSQGSTSAEQSLPIGVSSEETQITTYKGFYIARYEAGIPSDGKLEKTTSRNVDGTPVSKKNQVPWNYISWSKAKENAQNMYKLANTNNHVQSTLITDRMWETTMQWLEDELSSVEIQSDSKSWGNYYDAAVTGITEYSTNGGVTWTSKTDNNAKETSTRWLLKTGNTDYTSRKNIYDLAGNLWEWTNAKYNSSSSNYVGRGGFYGNNGTDYPAAYRNHSSDTGNNHLGFRCVLYIQ